MDFASDNTAPVHPAVMHALQQANAGHMASYGADALMQEVTEQIRNIFEAPDAKVFLVATGTAANALILSTLAAPYSTIFCARHAHIQEDECNAPEFYTGGAKLTLLPGEDAKIDPDGLRRALDAEENRFPHGPTYGALSLTQATERGANYTVAEISALCALAKDAAMPVHMDGARFANALVKLGCSPAEMTWKAGVTALSFGGTKNGLMGVEAVVFFDPHHAQDFELRRKRGGHLFSKNRFLSAQMLAYLTDDLWLTLATKANTRMARLAAGLADNPAVTLLHPADVNMAFAQWSDSTDQHLQHNGAQYSHIHLAETPKGHVTARMVTDWSTTDAEIDGFLAALKG